MRIETVLAGQARHGVEEGSGLLGRARGHPQMVGDADVADQHTLRQQRLPGASGVGEPAEQDEVGIAWHWREPLCCKAVHDPVTLGLDRLDLGEQACRCAKAARAIAWVGLDRW